MPRLFRESPLNSIWEGSGNINALDVLRALRTTPDEPRRLAHRGRPGPRREPHLDAAVHDVLTGLADLASRGIGPPARRADGAAACRRPAAGRRSAEVADLFCASRLGGDDAASSAPSRGPELATVARRTTPTISLLSNIRRRVRARHRLAQHDAALLAPSPSARL